MDSQNGNQSSRGFASMSKERQREIASRGGKAAHERGTAHEFSPVEASMAARIGHERGTAHEFTTEEARAAGRKGGLARSRNRQEHRQETMHTQARENPQVQLVDAVNSYDSGSTES
jgi:general stress protein YciG